MFDRSTRSSLTSALAQKCGCTTEQAYYFKHGCFLRAVSTADIRLWYNRDQPTDERLIYSVAFAMCELLLDPEKKVEEHREFLESTFNIELDGFDQIVQDYRSWAKREGGKDK